MKQEIEKLAKLYYLSDEHENVVDNFELADYHELLPEAIERLVVDTYMAGYAKAKEWISVEDRLPVSDGESIIMQLKNKAGGYYTGYEYEKQWFSNETDSVIYNITHWRKI